MHLIKCKYYTDVGDYKTPDQHCPHHECAHVHPSDPQWGISLPYDEERADAIRKEHRDKDQATLAMLTEAPMIPPPGQLFVDPVEPYAESTVPLGTDGERTASPTQDDLERDTWSTRDTSKMDEDDAGRRGANPKSHDWVADETSIPSAADPRVRNNNDNSSAEDVEMKETSESAIHYVWGDDASCVDIGPEIRDVVPSLVASAQLDDLKGVETTVPIDDHKQCSLTYQGDTDKDGAPFQPRKTLHAEFALLAALLPDELPVFNVAHRLLAKCRTPGTIARIDEFCSVKAEGGTSMQVGGSLLDVHHEQLLDRDRRISQNEETIRALKAQLSQVIKLRHDRVISSMETRTFENEIALALGKKGVEDLFVERSERFCRRDERLLDSIADALQKTISECAPPAVDESLSSTGELLKRLQWASMLAIPASLTVKDVFITTPKSSLLDSLFQLNAACTV